MGAEEGFTGLGVALFGVGSGGDVSGLLIGGFGVGAGGNVTGITIGGFGAGSGGNVKGVTIGGFGAGAGGNAKGLTIGGFGAGAPRVRAIVLSLIGAGGHDVQGGILAPTYFKVEDDEGDPGRMKGISISAFNHIKGDQFGLSIGLLNYAWELHGWQLGVLNYARNNPKGLRLLPLFNRAW